MMLLHDCSAGLRVLPEFGRGHPLVCGKNPGNVPAVAETARNGNILYAPVTRKEERGEFVHSVSLQEFVDGSPRVLAESLFEDTP